MNAGFYEKLARRSRLELYVLLKEARIKVFTGLDKRRSRLELYERLRELEVAEAAERKRFTLRKVKPPSPSYVYGMGTDCFGSSFVAFMTRQHIKCIYGTFKGLKLSSPHLDRINRWYKKGDRILFSEGYLTKGNKVLVMGNPIKVITGPDADEIAAQAFNYDSEVSHNPAQAELVNEHGLGHKEEEHPLCPKCQPPEIAAWFHLI